MSEHPFSPEDKIIILDFGSQYTQVIARRVRECRVYSEILPFGRDARPFETLRTERNHPFWWSGERLRVQCAMLDKGIYHLGRADLGICYGLQLLAFDLGGQC